MTPNNDKMLCIARARKKLIFATLDVDRGLHSSLLIKSWQSFRYSTLHCEVEVDTR